MGTNPHTKLVELLSGLVKFDEFDKEIMASNFEPVACRKKELLVKEGSIARYMYFINEGYIRTYYWKDGAEITNHINCPMGFITAYSSYANTIPSYENMECITDCSLLRISKEKLDALFRHSQQWAEAGRIINEQVVLYNEQRTRDMLSKTGEQRYLQLMQKHPDYIQYVPLQYIASFIGVQPESLSRIRRGIGSQAL